MLAVLRAHWRDLVSGFWFVPGAVVAGHVALAFAFVALDRVAGLDGVQVLFDGSGPAARTILQTIATAIVTVAGIALSLTIVTLQLVSGQFSPRSTRSLLADRVNQIAAGWFVGIFAYSLLVLRAVRERDEELGIDAFVPSLAVSVAIVLGVGAAGLLLVFIHNTAQSIKLPAIAGRVAKETLRAIDSLYPAQAGAPAGRSAADAAAGWEQAHGPATLVRPPRPGYVQSVDLAALAEHFDRPSFVHVPVRPGDFVTERDSLAAIRPSCGREVADKVRRTLVVGDERDVAGDPLFGLQQLKDIALRAISPSVNDPTTATTCIDYLAACLERVAARDLPDEVRAFAEHDALIAAEAPAFEDYLEEAFAQLPPHAGDVRVAAAIRDALARVADAAEQAGHRDRVRAVEEAAERFEVASVR